MARVRKKKHEAREVDGRESSESRQPPDRVDRLIEQWRKQLPELPLDAMELVNRIGQVAALGERALAEGMDRFGLKLGEFDVLSALRRAGGAGDVTPTELYRSLMLSSGAITHRLDRLEQAGLIERREDPRDRRGFRVGLTRKGKDLIDKAVVAHVENEERLLAGLSKAERESLNAILRKLLRTFG